MKLSEAIHLFEKETGHKSTPKNLPEILEKYSIQKDPKDATDAILHCLAGFENPKPSKPIPENKTFNKYYQKLKKERGWENKQLNVFECTELTTIIVQTHPEIFDINNPNDKMLLEAAIKD